MQEPQLVPARSAVPISAVVRSRCVTMAWRTASRPTPKQAQTRGPSSAVRRVAARRAADSARRPGPERRARDATASWLRQRGPVPREKEAGLQLPIGERRRTQHAALRIGDLQPFRVRRSGDEVRGETIEFLAVRHRAQPGQPIKLPGGDWNARPMGPSLRRERRALRRNRSP